MEFYLVGGAVRDKLLGLDPKDLDYVGVGTFEELKAEVLRRGGTIFVEKPEFVTVRARIDGQTNDYVCARTDGTYSDGRRPDSVSLGSLKDDLSRRDFTMNAMAMDEQGNVYDPFGGQKDLDKGVIRCVGNARDRLEEDSLRMLRAVRFAVQKNMDIEYDLNLLLKTDIRLRRRLQNVSVERMYEEVKKMFEASTHRSLDMVFAYRQLFDQVFAKVRLTPTLKLTN